MPDQVTMTIGDLVYSGWTEVEVSTGIDAVASAFRIGLTERWPGHPERWAFDAGAPVSVAIGSDTLVDGYVDRLDSRIAGEDRSITVTGRSKSGDLVDCSALNSPGSWSNQSLETIASAIAAPFGVTVTAEASTGAPFAKFAIQQGETAWDAIERMLKQRGLLGITDAAGNIRLVSPKPGAATVRITQGREPIGIDASHDVSERFSLYVTKGQAAGSDQASGATIAGPKAQASDPAVGRYRPLVVLAEDQATPASLQDRANWEAIVRAAKAQTVTVTLVGWRQPDGTLWAPMQLVQLDAPAAWISASLMVVSVTHRLDVNGRKSVLSLARPEAYTQLALPEDAKASSIERQRDTAPLRGRR